MKTSLPAVVVLGISAALVLAGASSANAASAAAPTALPPGQTLYAFDCDTHPAQLWAVSPNGASTPVGITPPPSGACAGGGQTSPLTGITYIVYFPGGGAYALATIDLTTGAITTIGPITGATTAAWQLVITNNGSAFVTSASTLYSIDLATAVTTTVGSMAPANDSGAVGYNPVNDTIYSFNYSNTIGIYTIDRTTGAGTDTGIGGNWPSLPCLAAGTPGGRPDSVAFDSAGFAWIQSDSCDSQIMSFDVNAPGSTMTGELFDSTATLYPTPPSDFYSETFFIAPAPSVVVPPDPPVVDPPATPALAATGFDAAILALAGGIGAVASLLGLVLVARARRMARS